MVRGAEAAGMPSAQLAKLKATPSVPRLPPAQWLTFPHCPNSSKLPVVAREFVGLEGKSADRMKTHSFYIIFGKKVLQWKQATVQLESGQGEKEEEEEEVDGERKAESGREKQQVSMWVRAIEKYAGLDATLSICQKYVFFGLHLHNPSLLNYAPPPYPHL